jgi:hypothetical protein
MFRSSAAMYSKENEAGYQFTVATRREYWLHWDLPQRVDPDRFTLRKMDPVNAQDYLLFSARETQVRPWCTYTRYWLAHYITIARHVLHTGRGYLHAHARILLYHRSNVPACETTCKAITAHNPRC